MSNLFALHVPWFVYFGRAALLLLVVNVILVGFNMIPAFPMDGGRVLRALLAMRLEYTRATQVAAAIGQGLAFLLGFIGLFANPLLIFTAFFAFFPAGLVLYWVVNSLLSISQQWYITRKIEAQAAKA